MAMTRDDIISMAFEYTVGGLEFDEEGLLRFVNTITAAEREACAKHFDENSDIPYYGRHVAAAIRARGQYE